MTTKRFYEINSQILGLKTIQDKNKQYTFPPIKTEKNHMFLKALNELVTDCHSLQKENGELKQENEKYKQFFNIPVKDDGSSMCIMEMLEENEQLKTQLDCIQNLISEHIKHQKTELGQKALKEVIQDYNKWLLESTGDDLND